MKIYNYSPSLPLRTIVKDNMVYLVGKDLARSLVIRRNVVQFNAMSANATRTTSVSQTAVASYRKPCVSRRMEHWNSSIPAPQSRHRLSVVGSTRRFFQVQYGICGRWK